MHEKVICIHVMQLSFKSYILCLLKAMWNYTFESLILACLNLQAPVIYNIWTDHSLTLCEFSPWFWRLFDMHLAV